MAWPIIAGALIGAGAGIYGAKEASDAQRDSSRDALDLQRQQFNTSLQMLDPQRAIGYGALSDLANLYGYSLPAYTPISQLTSGGAGYPGGGASNTVQGIGSASGNEWYNGNILGIPINPLNALGFGGRRDPQVSVRDGMIYFDGRKDGGTLYGGHINPYTGEVWVDTPNGGKDERLSAEATAALRSGGSLTDGRWGRFNMALTELQRSGWKYDPEAIARSEADQTLNPAAPGTPGNPGEAGTAPAAGNMARFFASPDYQFRLQEAQRALDNSAAARGSVLGGNAIRAQTELASNLASGEYNNYTNRLMQIAGLGQVATSQGAASAQNFGTTGSNTLQNMGDARASGIMGATNSAVNALNSGMSLYALQNYLRPDPMSGLSPVNITARRI